MNRTTITLFALTLALTNLGSAQADVWKWVDPHGETHYVDAVKPIFTWVDDDGRAHFGDTPGHENAVAVQLVWHSQGSLDDLETGTDEAAVLADETAAERALRLEAEAEHCRRLTEIHDSYVNAPQLYRTNEDGEREYLSRVETRRQIREIADAMKDGCK